MLQVSPDWVHRYSAKQAENDLVGFKFKGPGLYLTKTDTMIVLPDSDPSTGDPWEQNWLKDQLFTFYCYNVPFSYTIFSRIGPVRLDIR